MSTRRWLVTAMIVLELRIARADEPPIPGHEIDRTVTAGVMVTSVAVAGLSSLIPERDHAPWADELFQGEEFARDNFSPRASTISDGLLVLSVLAPAAYLTGTTVDDSDNDGLLLYAQTMAVDIGIAALTKHLVQRPRPYTYSRLAKVKAYAKEQGDDAYMSFYSGHAAATFGAATAGAYILSARGESSTVRGFAYGVGFGVAAMTATLRVRAGKHFPSDVVIGALIGTSVGYLVPALHADGDPHTPTSTDVGLAVTGILAGVLTARLLPLESRSDTEGMERGAFWQVAPTVTQGGAGFGVVGGW